MVLKIQSEAGTKTYSDITSYDTMSCLLNKELIRFYTAFNRLTSDVIVELISPREHENTKVVITKQHILYSFGGRTTTIQVGLLQRNRIVEFVKYMEETIENDHRQPEKINDVFELTMMMDDKSMCKSTIKKDEFDRLYKYGYLSNYFPKVSVMIVGENIADKYIRRKVLTFKN